PFLLRGVTGSGKTLVYIELLREVVERQGRGAIVLVPEIALTPQTVARFRAHFGDAVAVLHSALSDGERYDAWRALRRGEKRIAVGARSAVFAPIADLGAIVIDEEHEGSYKQSEAPRYHAREVAIMRARLCGAVCVLGSATPALESWHNAQRGKFVLLELPERIEGRPLPPVQVVDLRGREAAPKTEGESGVRGAAEDSAGKRPRVAEGGLSDVLVDAIRLRLERGEQTILLLNRRGYSTFVQCRDCGAVWHCANCNVSLTYHRARRRLVCHYCFHEEPPPVTCDACGSGDLSFRGIGTEQVERTVTETFPAARVARMDVDTTSAKWAHHDILSRVERGEVDILLGTQMIAKGLDFPGVTLVGVINADVGMNLPDFRASERTFQLLTQVSGRAGRGPRGGQVIVQTALPGHYAIRAAVDHDFAAFAARELDERRGPNYPPHSRLLNVVVSGTAEIAVQEAADAAAAWVRAAVEADGTAGVEVLGPAPCPVDRIRNRWRWHFLLRSPTPGPIGRIGHRILRHYTLKPGAAELRLILDRDPISLL
ncbi:MAG: primosomal protein N', partial [Gemmatimonadetes bacterium]|nr:primosomal protein N' [Gemmatimonadota bacterium]